MDAPREPTPLPASFSIGKYEIETKIGSGGFGTVFKAWDPVIKRPVAIKTCTATDERRARFLQEAEIAGRLHHPNITTVYEFGTAGETPYIVQEFLEGEDLSALIERRQPVPLHDKVKILVGISLGLEYAHREGVVHRDIKPANVRLLGNGSVKIMDFGIAKALGAPSVLTGSGVTVGSSAYMSPEQVTGDPLDARADVFSFGVLAYELLAYQKPFRDENLFRLLEAIVKQEPAPLDELAPDAPPALVALVERAMQKRPAARFGSMRELREALMTVPTGVSESSTARSVPLPASEAQRLEALARYEVLDTPEEAEFDDLVRLAARMTGAPMALISLVDARRQWFKARIGLEASETPRDVAFCAHAILGTGLMVVPDAEADERFADNPLVRKDPRIRFYAGAPLVTPEGLSVGTLCVLDTRPRDLTAEERDSLSALARQVVALLELRRHRKAAAGSSGERLLLEVAGLADERPSGGVRTES